LPLTPGAREIQAATGKPAIGKSASSYKGAISKNSSSTSSGLQHHRAGTKAEETGAAGHPTLTHHKVKQGETLYSIASSYNTTVSALKHDNRNIAALRPGMILVIRDVR
jgi:LysM repeat protein